MLFRSAGLTRLFNPDYDSLRRPDLFGSEDALRILGLDRFGTFAVTKVLLIVTFGYCILWGYWRSYQEARCAKAGRPCPAISEFPDERSGPAYVARQIAIILVGLVVFAAFFEAQPFALQELFDNYYSSTGAGGTTGGASKGFLGIDRKSVV